MACEQGVRGSLEARVQLLNAWLAEWPTVMWAADKLGAQPVAVAGAGSLWLLLFLLWGFMGELVCKVVGNLYPMYASFRALEDGNADEVSSWLVYWVAFSALNLLEGAVAKVFAWLPFYHLVRLSLIVWMFLPATQGSKAIYRWVVGPALRRNRSKIDDALTRSASDLQVSLGTDQLMEALRSRAADAVGGGTIEEFMAQELARGAARRMVGRVTATDEPVSRAPRTASPRPSPNSLRKASETKMDGEEEAKENRNAIGHVY